MPKGIDPNQKYKVVLDSDKEKTSPPTFIYRYLTGRQQLAAIEKYDNIDDKNSSQIENIRKTFNLAREHLIGWDNIIDPISGGCIEFNPDHLEDICTVLEAMELCQKVLYGQVLDLESKKKLESQSDYDSEESVKPATE